MPYYFMRDTPLQALEQLMMSQPGQKPRGGGIYRSPFHYTPKDVACEYCQNYDRKHPCRLCECTCLEERIEAGVLEMNAFMRDCFAPSMGPQFRKRMHQQLRERNPQFFLSNAHRRRWTYWRERCWRLSDRNKTALFLLTAYESLWRRMVWKCGNDGFDFQSVRLGGIEPELYSVYQAAKAIAVGCCNITLADLASPELVTDEAFHLITGALLMAKYLDAVKTYLDIDVFADAMLCDIRFKVPYIGELIRDTDCPAVEDYNDFAEALEDIWQQDGLLLTYAAVLEAEKPETLHRACELLQDLDNYQRITEGAYGYGQQRLQETLGLDDEAIYELDGYMDFEKYGQDCMENDCVAKTEFGLLRRLDPPFPEQTQGQQMFQ